MKKLNAWLLIAAVFLFATPAHALQIMDGTTNNGEARELNFGAGLAVTESGGVHTVSAAAGAITSGTITGATIDNSIIGGSTAAAATVTTLASNGNTTIGDAPADTLHVNANTITFEGATADASELTVSIPDVGSDLTLTVPLITASAAVLTTSLTTNVEDAANSVVGVSNGVKFEGATADAFETTLAPTDVTADATITLPTKTGTLHASGAAVALTPGATPTLTVVAGRHVVTYQPADNTDATFNASGAGSAGDEMVFIFTTDAAGSGDEVMTFGTNMTSTGTLTMANLASDIYVVSFISDGTAWREKSRTAVQTT